MKTLRRFCEYIFQKPKKMTLSSTVQKLRDELLKNCKYATELLETSMSCVTTSYSSGGDFVRPTAERIETSTYSTGVPVDTRQITQVEIVQNFMILTHGVLIQEWDHFLRGVFAEGLIYYLKGYNNLGTPKFNIYFQKINQSKNIEDIYKNISLEALESLHGYEELFDQSRKLFQISDTVLLTEMQKHIRIRHIFQHSRGKIRNKDISKIEGQYFEVVEDGGNTIKLGVGDEVFLSKHEIQKLFDTIVKYSEVFLTQSKLSVPAT